MKIFQNIHAVSPNIHLIAIKKNGKLFISNKNDANILEPDFEMSASLVSEYLKKEKIQFLTIKLNDNYLYCRMIKDTYLFLLIDGNITHAEFSILMDEICHIYESETASIMGKIKFWR